MTKNNYIFEEIYVFKMLSLDKLSIYHKILEQFEVNLFGPTFSWERISTGPAAQGLNKMSTIWITPLNR